MKTAEELSALKNEIEALNKKLAELNEEELAQVTGGFIPPLPPTAQFPDRKLDGTFNVNSKAVKV